MNLFDLTGRVAIVTGGNRGIGFGLALGLADAGAHVVLAARDQAALDVAVRTIRDAGELAEAVALDVQDIDAARAMVDDVAARHGHVDILINNAGMNIRKPTLDVQPEDYDRIMNINLRGAFFMAQAAARHMVAQNSGKIINIGSETTFIGLTNVAVYAATKGGIGQMTKAMATEWARHNVQVNAIAPGFIHTDLNTKLWENDTLRNWIVGRTPAGRLGKADDLVGAALFLASAASDFVSGHVLVVDGGFLSGEPWPL